MMVALCIRWVLPEWCTRTFEGAGGSLTVLDTEESPLSAMQASRHKAGVREGRLCSRNEPCQGYDEPERGRFPERGWNGQPRRSKSKQVRKASTGPRRMHS